MCDTTFIRPYDSNPYIVSPIKVYRYSRNSTNLPLRVFVYRRDNLFGDPTPLELAGLTIKARIYDRNNIPIAIKLATITNLDNSEVSLEWEGGEITECGLYYVDFFFTEIDDTTFVLPWVGERLQIISQ